MPRLGAIEAPLLAMQGAEDSYTIPAQLQSIAGAVPGTETILFEDLGHFPHIDRPSTVIREIVRFADRAAAGPSRR